MTKKEAKRARLVIVRDAALRMFQKNGRWTTASKFRVMTADIGYIKIAYTTPFQEGPPPVESIRYAAALAGRKIDHRYGLDIWYRNRKVLNVVWDDPEDFEIVSYKPGNWEVLLVPSDTTRGVEGAPS